MWAALTWAMRLEAAAAIAVVTSSAEFAEISVGKYVGALGTF